MQTFGAFLVSLLASGQVLAAPSTGSGKAFSVPVKPNPNYQPDGARALAHAYHKFGKTGAASKRDTGSVGASPGNTYDSRYLAEVDIGTPAQPLQLDFDTGSSDLWVFSTETESDEVNGQTLYNPGQSSSAQQLDGATWSITYGDHSTSSGDVWTDIVTIGGLSVNAQAVEAAQQVSGEFTSDSGSAGLLGLAFDKINSVKPTKQKTWFSNVKSSLSAPIFTSSLKHQAPGSYDFGYIDSAKYTGPLTYTPVSSRQGFWEWTSTGYQVGSGDFKSVKIDGIADTGTTLLLLPDDVVNDYYSQVDGASTQTDDSGNVSHIFPCDSQLPDFTFGVEDQTITVPGSLLNFQSTDAGCYGSLQSNGGGISIFGDIALKVSYVVFDAGSSRLGWAKAA